MHSRDSKFLMELDFRHSELLANPIHLLAIHIAQQYVQLEKTSTADTLFPHLIRIYVILYFMKKTAFACPPETSLSRVRAKDGHRGWPLRHYDPQLFRLHAFALLFQYDEFVLEIPGYRSRAALSCRGEVFPNRNPLRSRHSCKQMRDNQHFYSGEIPRDER
jgi:hypothetical protein